MEFLKTLSGKAIKGVVVLLGSIFLSNCGTVGLKRKGLKSRKQADD